MFYRVRIDLSFNTITNPNKVKKAAQLLLSNAIVINPGQPNEEKGYIQVEKCYHDQDPTIPCDQLYFVTP